MQPLTMQQFDVCQKRNGQDHTVIVHKLFKKRNKQTHLNIFCRSIYAATSYSQDNAHI